MKLNKKQKRTATIASMAALLAVVLGMGGQTFAKYMSTVDVATQTATVAKWGLTAQIDASNMFGSAYANGAASVVATPDATASNVSVKANASVVAPGTKGSMSITMGGYAEVDAIAKVNADSIVVPYIQYAIADDPATTGVDESENVNYYPLSWTIDGTDVGNVNATELAAKINALSKPYNANNDHSSTPFATHTIAWEWSFDGNDRDDTALAVLATKGTTSAGVTTYESYTGVIGVELDLSVTFTQVD